MSSSVFRVSGRVRTITPSSSACLGWLVVLAIVSAQAATAGIIGPYDCSDFSLSNSGFGDGSARCSSTDLVLTGPNDGSGLPSETDFTLLLPAGGVLRFDYLYTSLDPYPGYDSAGYLLDGTFYQFADASGQSASLALPVRAGQLFGFRVATLDGLGEPGILTVSNSAAAAVPEPGAFQLMIAAALLLGGCRLFRCRLTRRGRTIVTRSVLIGAFCAAVAVAQQPTTYFGTNVTGRLVLLRVVNLRQQAQRFQVLAPSAPIAEKLRMPPPRLRPVVPNLLAPAVLAPQVTVPMKSLTIGNATGVSGFNALAQRDQRLANNSNQFTIEPPNPSIAAANGYVLEGVNDAIQVYRTTGAPALPLVLSSNEFFGLAPAIDWATGVNGVYLTDMRVFYDQVIDRWLVIQRSQDNDIYGNELNQSHLYIGVSKSSDPTGDYNIYVMDTTNAGHPGCPCIADYPQIGADQYALHISYNEFRGSAANFVDASVLSLSKAALAAGAVTPTAYQFFITPTTGYEFAIQPAATPPGASFFLANGGVEYFVSTSYSFASNMALWAMTNTSSLATGNPSAILTRVTVPILRYTFPDVATQRPGPLPYGSSVTPPGFPVPLPFLDGGDVRALSLSYASGRLFLTFQTGVKDERGRQVVGGAYVVLSPILRAGTLTATVLNQGYLLVNGNHLLRPSVAVNAQGRGAVAVTLVGPDYFPSAAFVPFDTFSTPTSVQIAAAGALPEDGFTGYGASGGLARWGDYNTAVGAADGSTWMVVQYIGSYPRTPNANWNTFVTRKP